MPDPLPQAILCPVLIGRDAQVAALARLLDQARAGQGQIALISGEAGIGKSRLVAEVKRLALAQEMAVWQGACFEGERNLPYAPLLDLLRALPQQATVLAPLYRLLFEPSGDPAYDPLQHRHQLFTTLTHFLLGLEPGRPQLVVLEDAHWCDDLTCEFLLYFARQSTNQPILLLATYRDNEVTPHWGRLLVAWDRQRWATEVHCRRLTLGETAAMLQAVFALQRAPQADFVAALHQLTEGNPFFIEEVLKACVTEGAIFQSGGVWGRKPLSQITIPRTVQLAVQQRVAQLTPAARRLLPLAAVAGQRCDFDLLLHASGQDEPALIAQLKELCAGQLLVEEAPDHFSFRHALTRQAIYNGLLGREQRLLHRTVATTLESLPGSGGQAVTLAYHFAAANDWAKTLHYARRAGEQAQALHAPSAVAEQFGRALLAAQQLGLPPQPELLRARGQAFETLGDFAAARTDLEAALMAMQDRADQSGVWQALLDLGFLWTSRDFGQAGDYFQEALTLARHLAEPTKLAQTLNRIGNWHVNMGQPHAGCRYHEEALVLFAQMGDQLGVAATLDLLAGAAHFGGDIRAGMAYYRQAADRFRALGDRRGLASSLSWLAWQGATALNLAVAVAPLAECRQQGEEALQIARTIGWQPGEAFAMIGLAFVAGAEGNYGVALTLAREALAITQDLQHGWATVAEIALGALYLELGDFATAQAALSEAVTLSQQWNIGFGIHNATALLAVTHVRQGATAGAELLLVDKFGVQSLPVEPVQERVLTWHERLYWWARAELALQKGDAADAARIARKLLAAAQAGEADATAVVARLWLLLAQSEIAQQSASVEATLQIARQAAIRQQAHPILWRVEALLGQRYQSRGTHHLAEPHFAAARQVIETLAATLDTPAQREQFCAYALAHLPAPPSLTPLRATKNAFAGLTEREREVAILVAQGKSDRAIAEALVVSKRTASTHVTNILNKLGFSARSQIAAWAIEKKLASSPNE